MGPYNTVTGNHYIYNHGRKCFIILAEVKYTAFFFTRSFLSLVEITNVILRKAQFSKICDFQS